MTRVEHYTLDELWRLYDSGVRVLALKKQRTDVWSEEDIARQAHSLEGRRRQIEDVARGVHLVKKIIWENRG